MEKKIVVECEVDLNLEVNSDLVLDMKFDLILEIGSEECLEVENVVNVVNVNVLFRIVYILIL